MSLSQRLIGVIVLLSLVVAVMFVATLVDSSSQKTDALTINLAGRQRMLAQRVAKDSLLLTLSGTAEAASVRASLEKGIRLFEATQRALEKGGAAPNTPDPAGPTAELPSPTTETAALLHAADGRWQPLRTAAQAALAGTLTDAKVVGSLSEDTVVALSKAVQQIERESEAKVRRLIIIQITGITLVVGLLGWLLLMLRTRMLAPLNRLVHYADQVAGGSLQARLDGHFTHELQILAQSITAMVASLNNAMSVCTEQELAAKDAHAETDAALQDTKAKEARLQELLGTITAVSRSASDLSAKVGGAVEELGREIDTVDNGVLVQRDRMTETATAVEEMNATVMEVARNASQAASNAAASKKLAADGAQGVTRAVESIRQMQQRILGLKESMARLGVDAENIGRIMNVISDIADQTNLLALNAAIEAARAGDAGRGFAVHRLLHAFDREKTMQATREVGTAIGAIQETARENVAAVETAATNIVSATEEAAAAGSSMGDIVRIVEDTAGQVESIAAAAEEQSAASEEINRAVSEVTLVATDTAENMHRSAQALTRIISLIEDLNGAIQDLSRHAAADRTSAARVAVDNRQLFNWTPTLSTSIDSLDEEHKVLVRLINELHDAMRDNKDRHILGGILDRLKDYAVTHFEHEERHFARYNYPDAAAHIAQHQKFLGAVMDFYREFQSGRATVTLDLMRFLKDWLQGHIMGVDKKYGPFLKDKGVR
ncbi:bacteriohemerythrin [Megalodesulfovibrio gigas]|uniref:Putative methyl-accepting chemotaxis sensory transducer n=1 Tax=Megalodesulfovibrio gigas (strain ATCC 19364 / DSM 1382 / NCIMB 9332 / VKM B-1759) TaxID=1121448 RepID=T2GBK8_MEGG1|nr:bacteriohemerythrin [Megalodesulfovibrio gigas]AGW13975.1 putative methyl-accepting chemotaxis sensory transducer [Megalodesulfovibrio gigas DSM 1382 = ATCC 19364]